MIVYNLASLIRKLAVKRFIEGKHRCGVFSIRIVGFDDPQTLSDQLERQFGILTRSGIHCAPLAHGNFGTHELGGTTRLSLGPFITPKELDYTADALGQICRRHAQAMA